MRTKKLVVLAVAGLGAAGALAVSGVALADDGNPRSELHIVSDESGADHQKDCPERDGGASSGESGAAGSAQQPSSADEPGAGQL